MDTGIYLKQMELGPMQNFIYIVGSATTREVVVVDPAWEVEKVMRVVEQEGLKVKGLLVTHGHTDHTNGVEDMMNLTNAKVYMHKAEAEFFKWVSTDLVKVESGDTLQLGDITLTFLHTPGHTPGSQCFLLQGNLISGDTLFVGGCGRCDIPGGSPEQMYDSLVNRLMRLEPGTTLFPGHNYGRRKSTTLAEERQENPYLQLDLSTFLRYVPGPGQGMRFR